MALVLHKALYCNFKRKGQELFYQSKLGFESQISREIAYKSRKIVINLPK